MSVFGFLVPEMRKPEKHLSSEDQVAELLSQQDHGWSKLVLGFEYLEGIGPLTAEIVLFIISTPILLIIIPCYDELLYSPTSIVVPRSISLPQSPKAR